MFVKALQSAVVAAALLASASASAYDHTLAGSYAELFGPVFGAKAGKALHLITPEALLADLKNGVEVVAIDVRTPAESGVFTMALPGSLSIPANEMFKEENLDRLPTDKKIIVVCMSGTRATAVGTALRHIGFDNAYILKGGFMKLSAYLSTKTANGSAKPEKLAGR
jgi:rhodanese-related sulfurtransferase